MKKFFYVTIVFLFLTMLSNPAFSQKRYEDLLPEQAKLISFTGFYNYPPFGSVTKPETPNFYGDFNSVLLPTISSFAKENKITLKENIMVGNYEDAIQKVRAGEIDLVFGMYHESDLYKGIEYVYPAAISNPVTVMMMPDRVSEIKTLKDLEKLKGAISKNETFSDYVTEQLKRFKIQKEENSYKLFEKLFTGEVDYVLGSQFYLKIETAKLGISDQVGVANQTLWNMPLFLGVSKLSNWRKYLIYKLSKLMADKQIQEQIKNELLAEVKRIQTQNQGVVPPAYIKTQSIDDVPASQQNTSSQEKKE